MGELLMEITNALDNLVAAIKESNIYHNYVHVLDQVKINTDINDAIKSIKKIQKEMVNEQYKKGNDITTLEKKLEEANKYLNSIPLYQDYITSSEELNELMKVVSDKIQTYLNGLNL